MSHPDTHIFPESDGPSQLSRFRPSRYSRERATLRGILYAKLWHLVNLTLYRWSPGRARGWRRFLVRQFGGKVSRTCTLSRTAVIDCPWNFAIGEWSSIGDQSWVYALHKITIGDNACVGHSVRLLTGSHDISSPRFALVTKPIAIGSACWIATGATVLPGVTIHEGGVVGACAVVSRDVAPWTVVAGNPARFVKNRRLADPEQNGGACHLPS